MRLAPSLIPLVFALLLACDASARNAAKHSPPVAAPPADVAAAVKLERVASGLDFPVDAVFAPGDARKRLFIVEKPGRVRVLEKGKLHKTVFLDLTGKVTGWTEQGLLGLAFHPKFSENGKLYVNLTDNDGNTQVLEYRVSKKDPDRVDPGSRRLLLTLKQPYKNHNGGDVEFGPDGKLYIGTGDGGAAFDPLGSGQDRKSLLGKMLRLDVDAKDPRPEIVAIGLRNPWRYAFDPKTRDLFIADVGQNKWEEVHAVALDELSGKNFGWNIMEANHCLWGRRCKKEGLEPATVEYHHDEGCSITGGYVYRGKALPKLDGAYFYADYCTALIRSFRWRGGKVIDHWEWRPVLDPKKKLAKITSFGIDADGEMYILSEEGYLMKLVPAR